MLNQTTQYKYLGTTVDPTLKLTDNFNRSYKKASSGFIKSHLRRRCDLLT